MITHYRKKDDYQYQILTIKVIWLLQGILKND